MNLIENTKDFFDYSGKRSRIRLELRNTFARLGLGDQNYLIIEDMDAILKMVTFDESCLELYKNIGNKK